MSEITSFQRRARQTVDNTMDGITRQNDGVSSVQHTSYLRLRPAFDQDGRDIPLEILKLQETTSRIRSISTFSVFLSYVYGEDLSRFGGPIATCSVFIEIDEFRESATQVKFSNGGRLIVSENFRDMGIDTYVMNRIALWLKQTASHAHFPSSAFGTKQTREYRNDLGSDHGPERLNIHESVSTPFTVTGPPHPPLMAGLSPFTSDGPLQEINLIDELNLKMETARKSESDRIAVRIAHSFVLNKLVKSESLSRFMGVIIIVQIVMLILLIGYTWPIL
jgi:hypothetical protein